MARIGSADLLIVPRFDGLTSKVNGALSGVDLSSSGRRMGASLADGVSRGAGGLLKSGALVGAFSALTSKAMDTIGSHVGSAVSRLDTLKNYPVTMQQLGAASDEAQASITLMSDRLSTLPTTLDSMSGTVKGIWAATKDYGVSLDTATRAGLGLNDMLLAGGANAQVAAAAGEQFRQMLAKGKPDLQDWRSLISAAPGQMDQLAKSMLGPTANANDLYAALGGGGSDATISMSQLLDAIIALDEQGGNGLASLRDQAEQASGGIGTAMDNASNAVTRGIAGVLDAIGRENIASAINDVKGGINEVFGDIADLVGKIAPAAGEAWGAIRDGARGLYRDVRPLVPAVGALAAAIAGVGAARGAINGVMGAMSSLGSVAKGASGTLLNLAAKASGPLSSGLLGAAGAAEGLGNVLAGPWGVAIAAGVAGISLLVGHCIEQRRQMEASRKASEDFIAACRESADVGALSSGIASVSQSARDCTVDLEAYTQKMQQHADNVRQNNAAANEQIAVLSQVQGVIDSCIGKTDLDAEAQGRLMWALRELHDQTGLNITQEDVLAGKYTDQDGNVQNLRESIDQLIQKRIEEAKTAALMDDLTEAYKTQKDAADAVATSQNAYNDEMDKARESWRKAVTGSSETARMYRKQAHDMGMTVDQYVEAQAKSAASATEAGKQYEAAFGDLRNASDAIRDLSGELGINAQAASEGASAWQRYLSTNQLAISSLEAAGKSAGDFASTMDRLGANTDQFNELVGQNPERLNRLANEFDGTTASVVDDLARWGVGMDEGAQKVAQFERAVSSGLGITTQQLADTLQNAGLQADDFARACETAGIKSEDLKNISSEQFAAMAANCGGNMDALITMIQNYNGQPITDKDGNVVVDTAQLVDAQGRVYTWNGTTLVNQSGQAVVDDVSLMDAQGHLWRWNGSSLVDQNATADVNDVKLVDAQGHLYTWNGSSLVDQWGRATVTGNLQEALGWISSWNSSFLKPISGVMNIAQNVVRTVTGGTAWGGVVERRHAAGAVMVSRPGPGVDMRVVRDVVGEDGEEAVVPLNSRHARPFADMIAGQVSRSLSAARDGGTVNVYIDGARVNDDPEVRRLFIDFMTELQRRAAMNVG